MGDTGFVWHEKYMWHDTGAALGVLPSTGEFQPWIHFENPETKRRLKNLLDAYNYTSKLIHIEPVAASEAQMLRVHTAEYIARIERLSSAQGGDAGELTPFGPLRTTEDEPVLPPLVRRARQGRLTTCELGCAE